MAGLVTAERGHSGGWCIPADLETVGLRRLHEALGEPVIFAIGNRNETPQCPVEQSVNAVLERAFAEAGAMLLKPVAEVALADLTRDFARRHAERRALKEQGMREVIVIGGSYAGMAAALRPAPARRKVLAIDAGQRRNRFASHSHGFPGQDGAKRPGTRRPTRRSPQIRHSRRMNRQSKEKAAGSISDSLTGNHPPASRQGEAGPGAMLTPP